MGTRWRALRLAGAGLLAVGGASLVVAVTEDGGNTHGGTSGERSAAATAADGLVEVQTVTYTSSHGRRIAGLVATPRAAPSRGCVIWQYGLGSRKEDASEAWQAFASLGLSTFSIDFGHVIGGPNAIAALVRGSVADLQSALDYLENQPYCRHNVAYAGTGVAGIVGTLLAATDDRVKAAVMIATPGTFRAVLDTPGTPLLPGIARDPARRAAALRLLSPLDPVRFIGRIAPRPVLILSGLEDATVPISDARRLQAAARRPKAIVDYRGGHDPTAGPDAASNAEAVASFLLRNVVEPTYGISGDAHGTFTQQ
jgi:uncharacterized protein